MVDAHEAAVARVEQDLQPQSQNSQKAFLRVLFLLVAIAYFFCINCSRRAAVSLLAGAGLTAAAAGSALGVVASGSAAAVFCVQVSTVLGEGLDDFVPPAAASGGSPVKFSLRISHSP